MTLSALTRANSTNNASFPIYYQEMPDNLRELGKNQSTCASGGLSPSWDEAIDDRNKWVCTAQVADYVYSCCEPWMGKTRIGCGTAMCLLRLPGEVGKAGYHINDVFKVCLWKMAAANNDTRNQTKCLPAREINKALGKPPPGEQEAPKSTAPTTAAAPKAALAVLLLVGSAVAFC